MKFLSLLLLVFASVSASAAGTHPCGTLDSIGNLIGNPKLFGNIKIAYVSTEEPASAPDHVLVFVYDREMGVTCTALSDNQQTGFGSVDMSTLRSVSYDAKQGRLFAITVQLPNYESTTTQSQAIHFRVNSLNGKVTLE
jgi:hypothetical protein